MHIQHLEDLILTDGKAGGGRIIKILKDLSTSSIPVKLKWDGAPCITAGINPENGKFFVGTKAVFSKSNPKLCYTGEDILKHYPWNHCEDLRLKLNRALHYLPSLNYSGIFQGDLLFIRDIPALLANSCGISYYTFTPNTITYKCEIPDSCIIGIAVHTKYTGKTIGTLVPSFDISVDDFKSDDRIWLKDGEYDNDIDLQKNFKSSFTLARLTFEYLDSKLLDTLETTSKLSKFLYDFVNKDTQNNRSLHNADDTFDRFYRYVVEYFVKNSISREADILKRIEFLKYIHENKRNFILLFTFYYHIIRNKRLIIEALQKNHTIQTTIDGVECTHEGFIVDGIKLVNREVFTYNNYIKNEKRKANNGW